MPKTEKTAEPAAETAPEGELEAEVLVEAGEPTATCTVSAFRSAGYLDGSGDTVVPSGEVVFDELSFDDANFALEVAGKLATAAHDALRAGAEAIANAAGGDTVAESSAPGAS